MTTFSNGSSLPPNLLHACLQIEEQDNVKVFVKNKSLSKFGRNESLGTSRETVAETGGDEVFISTNSIDTVSSSDASDAQEVVLEGHTIDGNGDFTFVSQSVTLNGQNKVLLDTPLARLTRLYNNGSTDFAGDVYGYEDDTVIGGVPQTSAKIHIKAALPANQSEKCSTTLSKDDYWLITEITCSLQKKTSASVDFIVQMRRKGKVFRDVYYLSASNSSNHAAEQIDPPIIVYPNSDIRMEAVSSASNTDVTAQLRGYLVKIK